ncbi:ATP-dependent RNA helicase TDRD9 [Geodia barretti]|nr:ATP-dependent RNA helicase TDRD9 [Geodia barretti]
MTSDDTRLTFVTTGVLLEKLIGMKNMNEYTHIILDEVHERNLETDLCLLLVRKLLRTNSRHVKVVLMSATLESREYSQYFRVRLPSQATPTPAPVLSVDGRVWPVMEFYLDDLRDFGEVEGLVADNPRVNLTQRLMCKALINHFNRLEMEDPSYGRGDFFRGTVLCFLPGMPDIRDMERTLKEDNFDEVQRLSILPLHSSVSQEEQYRVFLAPQDGTRKVILATNIAESSITVPDIKYVVDFCMVKQLLTDQETGFDRLVTTWASKAALKQRKGRAGRVSAGRCYRLIKREFFRKYCPNYSVPEMQRRSIEHPVLKTKKLDMGEPTQILSLALQPPSKVDVEKAVTNLKELGALTVTCGGVVNPADGDLTFVGSLLEALPISARLGRLILLGHVFDCLEETVVIAAALSQRSIFTGLFNNEMKAYRSKIGWMERTSSDCIAVLFAYKEWIRLQKVGYFSTSKRKEASWCSDNMLHLNGLKGVADTVRDLSTRLARFRIQVQRDLANT